MSTGSSRAIAAIASAAWLSGAWPVLAQDISDERFGRVRLVVERMRGRRVEALRLQLVEPPPAEVGRAEAAADAVDERAE